MIETNPQTQEYTPREVFDVVEKSGIIEFSIDIEKRTIRVENKLDLYNLLSSFNLITFKQNGNDRNVKDADGVPVLDKIDKRVKFINSFEKSSPHYSYPICAVVGEKDIWTIMGSAVKAIPSQET